MMRSLIVLILIPVAGCTSLGAMPGMTGASYTPESRPGVEVSAGMVPGYALSSAATENISAGPLVQVATFLDPGEWFGKASGLGLGMRWVSMGNQFEPMLRYRRTVDPDGRIALGAVAYGTHASDERDGASLSLTRFGLELGIDARLTPVNRWAQLHVAGGMSLTGLFAEGRYCANDTTGYAHDCDDDEQGDKTASVSGAYPTGFLSLTLELFPDVPVFHGVQISAYLAGGSMPHVQYGEQQDARSWIAWGVNTTIGLGAW